MEQAVYFFQNVYARIIFIFLILFLFGNIVLLDVKTLTKPSSDQPAQKAVVTTITTAQGTKQVVQYVPSESQSCPVSCSNLIFQATASATTPTPTVTPTPKVIYQTTPSQSQTTPTVKTATIPLGTGVSSALTWTNVPGVQTYIDSSQYGSIKTVVFQASVNIPFSPQNIGVRLYNVTAQHPVWNSDVYLSSSNSSGLLISSPITLDSGNNLYQVQMQTQLQAPANLVQASIQITTN